MVRQVLHRRWKPERTGCVAEQNDRSEVDSRHQRHMRLQFMMSNITRRSENYERIQVKLVSVFVVIGVILIATSYANANESNLFIAIESGDIGQVEELLSSNASMNILLPDGSSPLHYAARKGNTKIVELLLRAGAEPNIGNAIDNGHTPLHEAASSGHAEVIITLLAADANPNAGSEGSYSDGYITGYVPLHGAAYGGHTRAVMALLSGGANPNAKDSTEKAPLHDAATGGRINAAMALLAGGADPNVQNKFGDTPLHGFAALGQAGAVAALLAAGANLSIRNRKELTPLQEAIGDAVGALVSAGSEPNDASPDGYYPLHRAAIRGDVVAIRALLSTDANPDVIDPNGNTPLHFAAKHGYAEIVRALLGKGSNPNSTNNFGTTPLSAAKGHKDIVDALHSSGADQ